MSFKQDTVNLNLSSDMIRSAVKTFTLSKRFTKVLMKTSILNIMYQRLVLNKSDLKERDLDGTTIIVFKRKHVKDPLLLQYLAWVEGVIDAIDKNYLKSLFIFMRDPVNNELIESYKFSLKYSEIDNKENMRSTPEVRSATLELFQTVNELGKNKKLSENTDIMLELTYVNTTPISYEPPGFEPSVEKYCTLHPNANLLLGAVHTGFHRVSCYGGGDIFDVFSETPKTVKAVDILENDGKNTYDSSEKKENNQSAVPSAEKEEMEVVGPEVLEKPPMKKLNMSNITISEDGHNSIVSDSVELTEESYACYCQLSLPLDLDRIECFECRKQYHAPCHGYLSKEDARRSGFVCNECSNNDPIMGGITESDKSIFCRVSKIHHEHLSRTLQNFFVQDGSQTL